MFLCACRAELSKAMVAAAARYSSHIAVTEAERLTPVIEALSSRCVPFSSCSSIAVQYAGYAVAKSAHGSESRSLNLQHARLAHIQW